MRSVRTRIAVTLVALVTVTVSAIGLGTYAFVDARLRSNLVDESARQAQFDLSVLLPDSLPPNANRAAFEAAGLPAAFRLRGDADLIVDFGDDDPYLSSSTLLAVYRSLPADLRATVASGDLGYDWTTISGIDSLIVGGRASGGPEVYLVVDASGVDAALAQLRTGLVVAGLAAVLVALAAAQFVSRRILRPIGAAGDVAGQIARGDLRARLDATGDDEFAGWAVEFNRMADSLEGTIERLTLAQRQNRRFVADVSHELRTPLTALVAEASLIDAAAARLPPEARRAAELVVGDIRRLRVLVDDLMELSRFDADAESVSPEAVDLGRVVTAIVAARLPDAQTDVPADPIVVETEVRRLDRILGNLLDNARIHAPGAPVDVDVRRVGDRAVVRVSDRGPGVPPAALPHLFDRFYKADPSRAASDPSTSGLGLAIAAEHAAVLGATLSAAPRDGGGMTFSLAIPVTESLPAGDPTDIDDREA